MHDLAGMIRQALGKGNPRGAALCNPAAGCGWGGGRGGAHPQRIQ